MQRLLCLATAAAALALSAGAGYAQSVDVEINSGPAYTSDYYGPYGDRRGGRAYGYRAREVVVEPQVILRPTSCGQYHYWDGTACADARVNPPNLR